MHSANWSCPYENVLADKLLNGLEFLDQVTFYLSKKIVKNVIFDLQVHFHMKIMLNGSD